MYTELGRWYYGSSMFSWKEVCPDHINVVKLKPQYLQRLVYQLPFSE